MQVRDLQIAFCTHTVKCSKAQEIFNTLWKMVELNNFTHNGLRRIEVKRALVCGHATSRNTLDKTFRNYLGAVINHNILKQLDKHCAYLSVRHHVLRMGAALRVAPSVFLCDVQIGLTFFQPEHSAFCVCKVFDAKKAAFFNGTATPLVRLVRPAQDRALIAELDETCMVFHHIADVFYKCGRHDSQVLSFFLQLCVVARLKLEHSLFQAQVPVFIPHVLCIGRHIVKQPPQSVGLTRNCVQRTCGQRAKPWMAFMLCCKLSIKSDELGNGVELGCEPVGMRVAAGVVYYQGDQARMKVNVGDSRRMNLNMPGSDAFVRVVRDDGKGAQTGVDFFQALDDLVTAVKSSDYSNIQRGISEVDGLQQGVSEGLAQIGTDLTVVDMQNSVLDEVVLRLKATRSDVEDLDYTEAITRMNKDQLALQAAQSGFAKISQLSLFNYIK